MVDDLTKKLNIGLTAEEVEEKLRNGRFNKDANVKSKSYGQIIRDNILSLFNLINLILFICVLSVGSLRNGLFFLVVLWNFAIGVVQEIRSKRTVDKLSLITAPKTYALRDGKISVIHSSEIVLGEIIKLKSGSQVCADSVVLDGECQVNESLITGESDPIPKKRGDHILSGSYVIAGTVMTEAERVGEENYVNSITSGAKYYKKNKSLILSSVKSVVRVITIALIPLTALMVWKNFFSISQSFQDAMIATVASVSAMIPGGLILLVSVVMTVSVIRLSAHKTLAQDLYCVENLARVDIVCLDKTGTLTEGRMKVERIIDAGGYNEEDLKEFARGMLDENSTISAVRDYFKISAPEEERPAEPEETRPAEPEETRPAEPEETRPAEPEETRLAEPEETRPAEPEEERPAEPEQVPSLAGSGSSSCVWARHSLPEQVPFSSDRKFSLLKAHDGGSLIMGAPEVICPDDEDSRPEYVRKALSESKRVVAFAKSPEFPGSGDLSGSGSLAGGGVDPCLGDPATGTADSRDLSGSDSLAGGGVDPCLGDPATGTADSRDLSGSDSLAKSAGDPDGSGTPESDSHATIGPPDRYSLPGNIKITAYIIIGDRVKDNAKETIDFFESQGVKLKVISGDNPLTASKTAAQAGLDGAERFVDASGLDSPEKIEEAADKYTVFGRVTPYQKLDIIKALKEKGHTVAMIGDGANDVLALKEADCSVAMQSGSDAARNVSSLVLLDSDFSSLPLVLNEGRKSINNLQRSAGLYLIKTTYAFILTVAFLFASFAYPFQSIQMTLIGAVTIGIPSFLLAFEPNYSRIRTHFLRNVFLVALPSGVLTIIALLASVFIVKYLFGATTEQIQTAATYTVILAGFVVVYNLSGKMNKWKWLLLLGLVLMAVFFLAVFPWFFETALLSLEMALTVAACAVGFFILHTALFRLVLPKVKRLSE